ncbi:MULTISPECIES: ABC transporter permease [Pseudonocardia]|uniref:ABC transporter permease n=1 Tax=Pseudonocardia TaxID=1847 RepID=UPI001AD6309F|nr:MULTISPECIES: ABC transporter permease [Pseudonocardia]MBO4238283.1 ABC transporter permease [Pseudonocardia alni]
MTGSATLPAHRAVALVARREFRVQVHKRSFWISNAIMVLVIVGGMVAYAVFGSGGDDRPTVGVAGDASLTAAVAAAGDRLGLPVEVREVPSAAAGRDAVAAGELDVALTADGPAGAVAVVDSDVPSATRAVLDAALADRATAAALATVGLTPAELAAATPPAGLTVDALDPADPEAGQRTALSFVVLIVMFMQIVGFGLTVAMGVVEEKSSRVVELLLSTIRPLHLLWGKVLGIGAVGLVQLLLYGVVGIGAGIATGLLTITGTALGVFGAALGWFVLGYAFFAVLYAAAGSLVSRQEDVNSTTGPLMMLLFAMYGVSFWFLGSPDSAVLGVLSWIPPFPAMLMPLMIADGSATAWHVAGSALVMLVALVLLAKAGARVYERSVLRIGATVPWREALRSR